MEKLLIELQKKDIVNKTAKGYYLNYNGEKRFIGKTIDGAFQEIDKIGVKQIIESAENNSNSGPSSEDAPQSPAQSQTTGKQSVEIDIVSEEEEVTRVFDRALGKIYDIKPGTGEGNALYIGVYDPKTKAYIDSRHTKHPVIKRVGLELRWVRNKSKKKSGEDFTARDYTVLRKSDYIATVEGKKINLIDTGSDDTPGEDFWSVGDLILASAKLDQVQNRRMQKLVKRKVSNRKELAQRQDFANTQSRIGDLDTVVRNLEQAVGADLSSTRASISEQGSSFNAIDTGRELDRINALAESDPEAALASLSKLPTSDPSEF